MFKGRTLSKANCPRVRHSSDIWEICPRVDARGSNTCIKLEQSDYHFSQGCQPEGRTEGWNSGRSQVLKEVKTCQEMHINAYKRHTRNDTNTQFSLVHNDKARWRVKSRYIIYWIWTINSYQTHLNIYEKGTTYAYCVEVSENESKDHQQSGNRSNKLL